MQSLKVESSNRQPVEAAQDDESADTTYNMARFLNEDALEQGQVITWLGKRDEQ
jgi:hypothetical protein